MHSRPLAESCWERVALSRGLTLRPTVLNFQGSRSSMHWWVYIRDQWRDLPWPCTIYFILPVLAALFLSVYYSVLDWAELPSPKCSKDGCDVQWLTADVARTDSQSRQSVSNTAAEVIRGKAASHRLKRTLLNPLCRPREINLSIEASDPQTPLPNISNTTRLPRPLQLSMTINSFLSLS